MSCIYCFYSESFQKSLMMKCESIDRFEDKLKKYRDLFISEMQQIVSIEKCDCTYRKNATDIKELIEWTEDLRSNMQKKEAVMRKIFNEVIEIYELFLLQKNTEAEKKMQKIVSRKHISLNKEPLTIQNKMFYRGRKISDIELYFKDKYDYYHIPFNKREKVGNQRFSAHGQPMLYLGQSIICCQKELELDDKNLSVAAFTFKKGSLKIYELRNQMYNSIARSLYPIINAGLKLNYWKSKIEPNGNSLKRDLEKTILFQILTFPTQKKDAFIPEYTLPQIFTKNIFQSGYDGISYQSTKNYDELVNENIYSDYKMNLVLFTHYNENASYDDELLKKINIITVDCEIQNIMEKYSFEKLEEFIKSIGIDDYTDIDSENCKNTIMITKLQLDYLKDAKINNIDYFSTIQGKKEIYFLIKYVESISSYRY